MKTKAIIGGIVAIIATGVIVTVVVTSKKDDKGSKDTGKNRNERIELIADDEGSIGNSRRDGMTTLPPPTEDTEDVREVKAVSEDSIFICMDGMSSDEIVENLWKTTNVYSGMYSGDFYENLVTDGCSEFKNKDDKFSWTFYESSDTKCYISRLAVFSGFSADPTFDGNGTLSNVHITMHVEDESFANEVAGKIIEKLQLEGYEIRLDNGSDQSYWTVQFQGNNRAFNVMRFYLTDYVIDFSIPLIGK